MDKMKKKKKKHCRKSEKFHKSDGKIVETKPNSIHTHMTQIYNDHSCSWLGADTSLKCGGAKIKYHGPKHGFNNKENL